MLWDFAFPSLMAFVAGAINSVAGGGTLLSFPALVAIDPLSAQWQVTANATNTTALCPGSISGAWAYRRELRQSGRWALWLLGPSVLGGILGAVLLAYAPAEAFVALVPWLILTATLLLLMQPAIARWTGIGRPHPSPSAKRVWGIVVFQFFIAVYGGYFGAGIGILMLSALSLMGLADIHQMNALKSVFAACINGVAIVVFIVQDTISWPHAVPMIVAGSLGGYAGAHVARSLDRNLVRSIVVALGFCLAAWFFYQRWQTA